MFDCHIHSNFSGDSDMLPELACETAIQSGLEGIIFTDHLDYDYPDFDDKFNINFLKYSICMEELKEKYKCKLNVLKGIEVGIQPHIIKETNKIINEFNFDFVIASIHVIDNLDPYAGSFYIGKSKEQAYLRYLEEIYFSVKNFDNYDVIGHIGYIRRYGDFDDRSLKYLDYTDIIDSILKKAIENGKGIEINTSGYRSGLDSPMPDFDIVIRYKELGGEILTIGSDAHFPEHIGHKFDDTKEIVKSLGFKHLAHFVQRKPVFDKM